MLGLPMAPSVLLQMVGEQVATHVRETLAGRVPGPVRDQPDGPGSAASKRSATPCSRRSPTRSATSSTEGVVDSPKDVDAALILGAGFPFFMGGLTPYLHQHGYSFELSPRA